MKPFLILLLLGAQAFAGAASYSGYAKKDPTAFDTFEDAVAGVEQTPGDFQIAFTRRAPFFRFPKTSNERMVERFLREAQAHGTRLKVEYNPYTSEIYRLSSDK